jgi:hypothetical protein
MRLFKASTLALAVLFLAARLALAAVCPGCGTNSKDGTRICPACGTELPKTKKPEPKKPEPKKPEPKKPEPKKPEPKRPEPKRPEPRKPEPKKPDNRPKAKRYYDAAYSRYQKDPKDFDGAIKGFTLALKGCAGTRYASRCEKMLSRIKAEKKADEAARARAKARAAEAKSERDAKARLAKARSSYDKAYATYRKNRMDHAGNIKNFEAARKVGAGTRYQASSDKMLVRIKADKKRADALAAKQKAERDKKTKLANARKAYETAYADYRKNPKDLDGNIKKFEAVKKSGAGTGYDRKADKMLLRLNKEKQKLAARKPAPKKPEPKKPEPKKPEPKKPEPKKPEPKKPVAKKVNPKAEYKAALTTCKKNPRAYAANIKLFEATKKKCAGSKYERSCDKMLTRLKADKAEAELATKTANSRKAYETAYADYKKNPKDLDGNIKKFEAVKKSGAGTGYDRKADKMLLRLNKEKQKLAARKPAPKKPEPKKPEPKKPEPKKPEPKKPEPKKPEPKKPVAKKVNPKAEYKAALTTCKKNPKAYAANIKLFEATKKKCAGSKYERSCDKMLTRLKADKAEAELATKTANARKAYETAYADYKKNPKDLDGNIKKFEAVKKSGAGTGYDRKADKMLLRLNKEKQKLAARKPAPKKPEPKKPEPKKPEPKKPEPKKPEPKKPEPKKPEPKKPEPQKPISSFVTKKVRGASDPDKAFAKAQKLDKTGGTKPRQKAEAALPFYFAAVSQKTAAGKRGKNASAAALRIGELVEAQGDGETDTPTAAKYYLISAFLNVEGGAWKKADRLYVKMGKGAEFAGRLKVLAGRAEKRGNKKLAAALKARAAELAK